MTFVHGRKTKITIDGDDLSAFTKTTSWEGSVTTHDVTTYGPTREDTEFAAGLGTGKITISGVYDDGATGPDAVLEPLMNAKAAVAFVFQPKGTGTGLPQKTCNVIVSSFNFSDPVDNMVQWTADLQRTGSVDRDAQA